MRLFAIAILAVAAATAAPQITPRAELPPRQISDPAFLGWVSASPFADPRSCAPSFAFTRSGFFADCCSPDLPYCDFATTCSDNTAVARRTAYHCNWGKCNTAIIVPSVGASSGVVSAVGCWAESLGTSAFTLVRDIGTAAFVAPWSTGSVSGSSSPRSTPVGSSLVASSRASGVATSQFSGSVSSQVPGSASSQAFGSSTQSATGAAQSTGAAAVVAIKPLTGVLGMIAMLSGLL